MRRCTTGFTSIMKVEGAVAPIAVLHKIKVKEEPKGCPGLQQSSTCSASTGPASATSATSTTSVTSTSVVSTTSRVGTGSPIVSATIEPSETSIIATTVNPTTPKKPLSPLSSPSGDITSTVLVVSPSSCPLPQPSGFICQASAPSSLPTMVNKSSEPFPVDLDLKTKVPQGMSCLTHVLHDIALLPVCPSCSYLFNFFLVMDIIIRTNVAVQCLVKRVGS